MKKVTLLFSAVVFLTYFHAAAQNNTVKSTFASDLVTTNFKGKVQSFTQTSSTFDSTGTSEKADSMTSITDFNEKGFRTRFSNKSSTGMTRLEVNYSRHPNDAIKEFTATRNGKQIFRTFYEIGEDGRYKQATSYDSSNVPNGYLKEIVTDEFGSMKSYHSYGKNGNIKSSYVSKRDKAISTGMTNKDSSGKIMYDMSYKLNEKGDPVEMTDVSYTKDSVKTEKETYRYNKFDSKGNWIERTVSNEKGKPISVTRRTFTYYKD